MLINTTNKIRERDLDEVLLTKMFSHGASVDMSSALANYLKKTDVLAESNIPTSYTDTFNKKVSDLQTQLDGLQKKCTSGAENDTELQTNINSLTSQLNNLKTQVSQITASDGTSLADAVNTNKKKIEDLTEQLASVQSDLNTSLEKIKAMPSADKITTLSSRIEEVNNRFNTIKSEIKSEFDSAYRRTDVKITKNDLDASLQNTLTKAEELAQSFSGARSTSQVLYGSKGQLVSFNDNGNPTSVTLFHTDTIICSTDEEVQANIADEDVVEDIINLSSGKIYTINPTYDKTKSDSERYIEKDISESLDYNNSFLYDEDDSTFQAIIEGKVVSMKKTVFSKNVTISAGGSSTIARSNVFNKPPIVFLVKDTLISSRTNGKYINAEGVATIAYDENAYIVYNDDKEAHDFILYGED